MKKMLWTVLVLAAMLSAAFVPADRAQKIAENYYQNYAPAAAKGSVVQEVLTKDYQGLPTWYAFNFTNGFVIVSADDVLNPILGYSFDKDTKIDSDLEDMRNPFNVRFGSYAKGIAEDAAKGTFATMEAKKEWKDIENNVFTKAAKADVGPLVESKYNQGYPYNLQCPLDGGSATYVGCVATAMHQIMRYHQGPAQGYGSNEYTWNGQTLSVTFSNYTYDYGLMPLTTALMNTEAIRNEVSKMSYHAGVSVNMDYGADGSGAFSSDVRPALVNNFGFDTGATTVPSLGTFTPTETSYAIDIQTDINDGRPLYWSGNDGTEGHAFVLDGYSDNYYYHFNWGWGGSGDGWFKLNEMQYNQGNQFVKLLYVDGNLAQWPAPESLSGSVTAQGDVNLSWSAPTPVTPMGTRIGYDIFRDGVKVGSVGSSTLNYTDEAIPEGNFNWFVKAVYENPDGSSPASNTYNASITPDPSYPVPVGMKATSYIYNRQKIDLAWTKPFIGSIAYQDGFETGNTHYEQPVGWIQRGSNQLDTPGMSWAVTAGVAPDQGLLVYNNATYAFQGEWAMLANDSNDGTDPTQSWDYVYAFTPEFYMSGANFKFWYLAPADGGIVHIVLYNGDFSEGDPSPYLEVVETINMVTGTYVEEQEIDFSAYTGNYRVGFCKQITNLAYSFFDNMVIGTDSWPDGDQPVTYNVYRDGQLIDNIPVTGTKETYECTDFADGLNSFYVRAIWPTGSSIGSNPASAWIDANPQPYYLEGAYDGGTSSVDLSWFAPGHYPPQYNGWFYDDDEGWNIFGYTDDGEEINYLTTNFYRESFGIGNTVYMDTLSLAFIEDLVDGRAWTSSQFKVKVGLGEAPAVESRTYMYESGWLTADPTGEWVDHGIVGGPLSIDNDAWFVEVELGSPIDATPSMMTMIHALGVETNSFWWYGLDGVSFYNWIYGEDPGPYQYEDFFILCHIWNDEPTITKNTPAEPRTDYSEFAKGISAGKVPVKNTSSILPTTVAPQTDFDKMKKLHSEDSKALQSYQIWRNDTRYATTSNEYYSDASPLPTDADYYITAIYNDPVGESLPSNMITVGPPAYVSMPASIAKSVSSASSDTGIFALGNTGIGQLTYDLSYEYTDTMTQLNLPAAGQNNFNAGLGWTSSGYWQVYTTNTLDGSQCAYVIGQNGSAINATLASATFDGTGCEYVDFDHYYGANADTDPTTIWVEYSLNGGSTWSTLYTVVNIETGAWGAPNHQHIAIPSTSTTMQVRFRAEFARRAYDTWAVDNVSVSGETVLIEPWFSYVSATSGTVDPSSSVNVTCNYDATLLPDGEYHANVIVLSNDPDYPTLATPVVLTVGGGPVIPAVPANLVTSVVGGQLVIDWDVSADATEYYIYSSADPYGAYDYLATAPSNTYTYTGTETKMFFYVIAGNATKTAPKTIEIAKPATR